MDSRSAICGRDDEDAHHATVRCTKAVALRQAMRKHWHIPHEDVFRNTVKDWLLICLSQVDANTKTNILMLLWRAWHLRNDIVHEKGLETIAMPVSFLLSYNAWQPTVPFSEGDAKGKAVLGTPLLPQIQSTSATAATWSPPPPGWIKINFDASFIAADKASGAGTIARNHQGEIVLDSCSLRMACTDPEDAEAKAVLESTKLLVGRGHDRIILELDCAAVAAALRSPETNRSRQWDTYDEVRRLLSGFFDVKINWVKRESNKVADCLAKLARSEGNCIWIGQPPDVVNNLVIDDLPRVLPL